jgi:5-methylcytosine-specific restriction endonuclease McrA
MAKARSNKTSRKRRAVVDPCPSHPSWSSARYRTFVRSAMRRAWLKWPPRFEALKLARRPSQTANKKQKWEFQCAICKQWHMGKSVAVDHITPWGRIWELSLAEAWSRLLVGVSQLQVLCDGCHDHKTQSESI